LTSKLAATGIGVGVGITVGVGVTVGVAVGEAVGDGETLGEIVGATVGIGVAVGVAWLSYNATLSTYIVELVGFELNMMYIMPLPLVVLPAVTVIVFDL
jgi:hypothetical protein